MKTVFKRLFANTTLRFHALSTKDFFFELYIVNFWGTARS